MRHILTAFCLILIFKYAQANRLVCKTETTAEPPFYVSSYTGSTGAGGTENLRSEARYARNNVQSLLPKGSLVQVSGDPSLIGRPNSYLEVRVSSLAPAKGTSSSLPISSENESGFLYAGSIESIDEKYFRLKHDSPLFKKHPQWNPSTTYLQAKIDENNSYKRTVCCPKSHKDGDCTINYEFEVYDFSDPENPAGLIEVDVKREDHLCSLYSQDSDELFESIDVFLKSMSIKNLITQNGKITLDEFIRAGEEVWRPTVHYAETQTTDRYDRHRRYLGEKNPGRSLRRCYQYVKMATHRGGLLPSEPGECRSDDRSCPIRLRNQASAQHSGTVWEYEGFVNLLDVPDWKERFSDPRNAPVGAILVYSGGSDGHVEFRSDGKNLAKENRLIGGSVDNCLFVSDFCSEVPISDILGRRLTGVYVYPYSVHGGVE